MTSITIEQAAKTNVEGCVQKMTKIGLPVRLHSGNNYFQDFGDLQHKIFSLKNPSAEIPMVYQNDYFYNSAVP